MSLPTVLAAPAAREQRARESCVEGGGFFELALRDALAVGVRVEYGAGADEQRRAPVRQVRDVGREADDLTLEAFDRVHPHRLCGGKIFYTGAARHRRFENFFDDGGRSDQADLQLGLRLRGDDVRAYAAVDSPDVAGRLAEELVARPHPVAH